MADLLAQFKAQEQLKGEIEKLGLAEVLEKDYSGTHKDRLFQFTRKPSGQVPALEVVVDHSSYGYHVIVNAVPYDQKYHRSTGSPITDEQVVGQIRQYLGEVAPQDTQ